MVKFHKKLKDSILKNPTFEKYDKGFELQKKPVHKYENEKNYNDFTKNFLKYIKDINAMEDTLDFILAYQQWDGCSNIFI